MLEKTLSIVKPDAVERNLEDKIQEILVKKGLTIKEKKKVKISKEEASEFYKVHQTKPFYDELCSYLSSWPIVVMILEGENAVLNNREIMGATDNSHVIPVGTAAPAAGPAGWRCCAPRRPRTSCCTAAPRRRERCRKASPEAGPPPRGRGA